MPLPVLVNSIDTNVFWDLVGAIYLRQTQVQIITRLGVTGEGLRNTGDRGVPFQLVSTQYYVDWNDYLAKLTTYKGLSGTNPVHVTRNGVDHGTFGVLEVTEVGGPQAVLNVANAPGMQVRAEVRWKLIG